MLDDRGEIIGILSDRDIQRAMHDPDARVREYMSSPVKKVSAHESIRNIANRMVREKFSSSTMKTKKTHRTDLDAPLLPSLQRTLERHLAKFPLPQRACSCMTVEGGKVRLATRFVANAGSWSHIAEGITLADAYRMIRHRLARDLHNLSPDAALAKCGLGAVRSCGNHTCANAGRCPNSQETSRYLEVARIDPEDRDAS